MTDTSIPYTFNARTTRSIPDTGIKYSLYDKIIQALKTREISDEIDDDDWYDVKPYIGQMSDGTDVDNSAVIPPTFRLNDEMPLNPITFYKAYLQNPTNSAEQTAEEDDMFRTVIEQAGMQGIGSRHILGTIHNELDKIRSHYLKPWPPEQEENDYVNFLKSLK